MARTTTTLVSRSPFVTTVAWISIGLAGAGTLIALLQNLLFALFSQSGVEPIFTAMAARFGPAAQHIYSHFQLFIGLSLGFSALLLVAAIGLLKRRNWARILYIVLLAAGIAWSLAIPVWQGTIVFTPPEDAPDAFRDFFEMAVLAVRVFSVLIAVGMSLFLAWLIRRLVSAPVRAEFASHMGHAP